MYGCWFCIVSTAALASRMQCHVIIIIMMMAIFPIRQHLSIIQYIGIDIFGSYTNSLRSHIDRSNSNFDNVIPNAMAFSKYYICACSAHNDRNPRKHYRIMKCNAMTDVDSRTPHTRLCVQFLSRIIEFRTCSIKYMCMYIRSVPDQQEDLKQEKNGGNIWKTRFLRGAGAAPELNPTLCTYIKLSDARILALHAMHL